MNILIEDIYAKLMNTKEGNKTILIGIDGCGGAGKSTLAQAIRKVDPKKVTVIHMDDFYKPSLLRESVKDSDIGGNWDINRVKDQILHPLSQNQNTEYQRYDWNEDALVEWHKVPSGGLVVMEGCYRSATLNWTEKLRSSRIQLILLRRIYYDKKKTKNI
ncbi:uridine kinase [Chengkuizengella sp. SCS-71B]|uniref:uridine kinase family protein n=1 Tax=Chengkuizengella sp. SCS-71B TaxID=3115290 RepID=UPI0032C2104E